MAKMGSSSVIEHERYSLHVFPACFSAVHRTGQECAEQQDNL
jgi:hypothetical protein